MNKRLLSVAIIATSLLSATAKNDDPVLMTINGKDVKLSEFEYLYNKNNSQQIQKQSIDDYVDMFVTYKLKVADAEAAGIDKTETFIKEFNGYRNELARPYLKNQAVEDSLAAAAYSHYLEDVDVSHIMIGTEGDPKLRKEAFNKLDSIRTAIINGESFEDNAVKYSIDRSARYNKGRMGFISATKFPYTFEDAAYNTAIGEISPVIETEYGLHIVKVHARRPSLGTVSVQHILKLTRGETPEVATQRKTQIDSIYNLVKKGADFSDLARRESQDPGTASKGGMLPWFGANEMVPEFEKVAFALKNGEISEPFATSYGYHIIHRIDGKGAPTFEECRDAIIGSMHGDGRGALAELSKLDELKKEHNAHFIDKSLEILKQELEANNGYDSTFIKKFQNSNLVIGKVQEVEIPLSDVIRSMPTIAAINPENGYSIIMGTAQNVLNAKTREYEASKLHNKHADFRNLINEYRDGMLLFEISNRNVWEKASKDKEGLEAYFQKHKYQYAWDGPKYKGYVIFTTSDSLKNEVSKYLATEKIDNDSLTTSLRSKFGRDVKVERVIAGKGENEIIDYIAFYGNAPKMSGKWKAFIPYNGKTISWAEEAADVRGPVTSDYQAVLEKEWVKSLYDKYPVKINKKVLNKLK